MRFLWIGLLAIAPGMAVAQQVPEREQPRTLTVNGVGTVERAPERARLLVAVESEGQSAAQAGQANAEAMDRVVAALRRAGLSAAQVRTVSYHLNPVYQGPGREGAAPRISGYRAVNMVQITVDSIARLGAIIDATLGAGANRIANLSFELRDYESAQQEALELAVANARRTAVAVARAAGQELGDPLNINMSGGVPEPRPMYDVAMAQERMAAVPTPIEGGTLRVTAHVHIVYKLETR
jgi:uncharacterized protein YggE